MFESGNKPNKLLARLARNFPSKSLMLVICGEDHLQQKNNFNIISAFYYQFRNEYWNSLKVTSWKEIRQ